MKFNLLLFVFFSFLSSFAFSQKSLSIKETVDYINDKLDRYSTTVGYESHVFSCDKYGNVSFDIKNPNLISGMRMQFIHEYNLREVNIILNKVVNDNYWVLQFYCKDNSNCMKLERPHIQDHTYVDVHAIALSKNNYTESVYNAILHLLEITEVEVDPFDK